MPVQVNIPAVFRNHVDGLKSLQTSNGSLKDVLVEIGKAYPSLGNELWGNDRDLHRFVNVYVNDEDVRYMAGLDTAVKDGDVVSILPAVAGGALLRRA
jgi:molybdopterin synthase sulfur carrier subunit